jgi:hypothetical protein
MKTNKSSCKAPVLAICAGIMIFFTSCVAVTNVNGIKPVYPPTGLLDPTVDSLQPEMKWEGDRSQKYDLAIWDSVTVDIAPQKHKIIYKKTGISGNSHKLEIVLEPSKMYFWSVRETGSEEWSTTKLSAVTAVGYGHVYEVFVFKTPKAEDLKKASK